MRPPWRPALDRLARAAGVALDYVDGLQQRRHPHPETIVQVLRCLDVPIESPADAPAALRAFEDSQRRSLCPPVVVAWQTRPSSTQVAIPLDQAPPRATCHLRLEGGAEERWQASLVPPRRNSRTASYTLPPHLPDGVHHMMIEVGSRCAECTLLAASPSCYRRRNVRELGVFLPLYALRSERNWGVGDLTDLERLAEWAHSAGCAFLGTLPLFACYQDKPFDPSPYSPVSRLFWNELFLDVEATPEFTWCAEARRVVSAARETAASLRTNRLVDYRKAYALKRPALDALARQAFEHPDTRGGILRFTRENPLAAAYAAFRATVESHGPDRGHWPAPPDPGRLEARNDPRYLTHLYAQFALDRQLEALHTSSAAGLYLDMPVGSRADGFDAWHFRNAFAHGLSVGAPPDALFSRGQNWGFPPAHPIRARHDAHAYFRACLRAMMARCSILRIDHVMGLHRVFCVPHGCDEGTYVAQPADELYAALAIESRRAGVEIVGENLGTVPTSVNNTLKRRAVMGMHVAQFELGWRPKRPLPSPRRDSLACMNTHDTPPFAAFWEGDDIVLRERLGLVNRAGAARERRERVALKRAVLGALVKRKLIPPRDSTSATVLRALLRLYAKSSADKLLVNLEDLWDERDPQNVPGVTKGTPNWRRKASRTLESIVTDTDLPDLLRRLAVARSSSRKSRSLPSMIAASAT